MGEWSSPYNVNGVHAVPVRLKGAKDGQWYLKQYLGLCIGLRKSLLLASPVSEQ